MSECKKKKDNSADDDAYVIGKRKQDSFHMLRQLTVLILTHFFFPFH